MGCEDCGDTGVVKFEDHEMPCPYCRPDDAREAASRYDPPPACPVCRGPLVELGSLGKASVLRCRNCGMECIVTDAPDEDDAGKLREEWERAHRGPHKTP